MSAAKHAIALKPKVPKPKGPLRSLNPKFVRAKGPSTLNPLARTSPPRSLPSISPRRRRLRPARGTRDLGLAPSKYRAGSGSPHRSRALHPPLCVTNCLQFLRLSPTLRPSRPLLFLSDCPLILFPSDCPLVPFRLPPHHSQCARASMLAWRVCARARVARACAHACVRACVCTRSSS